MPNDIETPAVTLVTPSELRAKIDAAAQVEKDAQAALAAAKQSAVAAWRELEAIDETNVVRALEPALDFLGYKGRVFTQVNDGCVQLSATNGGGDPIVVSAVSKPICMVKIIGALVTNRFPAAPGRVRH